jgi:hypothetical protein
MFLTLREEQLTPYPVEEMTPFKSKRFIRQSFCIIGKIIIISILLKFTIKN